VLARERRERRRLAAADARDDVRRAHARAQLLGDDLEDAVAERVAVLVVDLLEAVEVDEHQRQLAPVARGALDLGVERRLERASVGEAGERVGGGLRVELGDVRG
jgi:hypothetical protein